MQACNKLPIQKTYHENLIKCKLTKVYNKIVKM